MEKTETLEHFYRHKFDAVPQTLQEGVGHFNVFKMDDCSLPNAPVVSYSRRDFYKVCLIRGKHIYHYADKSLSRLR